MRDLEALIKSIREIASNPEEYPESKCLHDIISTAIKFTRDRPSRGDMKMVTQAFKELRYAFRVFAPYRRIRKVAVFGSARTPEGAPEYEAAFRLANQMIRIGWMVVTGAGPGIMQAAQGGAGRSNSFGVNIRLPFEQKANPVIADDPKLVNFKYFFSRKVVFVKEVDAICLFPGGFGTFDEAYESLTLIQTGKSKIVPIVCIDEPGGTYWQEWLEYVRRNLSAGRYIDPTDLHLVQTTQDVDEAVEIVRHFYSNFHSFRYLPEYLVLRVVEPVSDALLDKVNSEFGDLLSSGRFQRVDAHRYEERDEPETASLHRIGGRFERKRISRLRQLINLINDFETTA